jgi:cysteine-rich repeat protein
VRHSAGDELWCRRWLLSQQLHRGQRSTTCGNGTLDARESCEPRAEPICAASCDDGEPCTQDYKTGSAARCSLACTHVPITRPLAGDGCCPAGASANTDTDCSAMCGNGKQETGEQCDDGNLLAGDGCGPQCKKESPLEVCMSKLDGRRPECAACNCEKCGDQVLACYAAKSVKETEQCVALARCGLDKGCASEACYCGSVSFTGCALGLANGPCRAEVEAAAGSTFAGDIVTRGSDVAFPVGRANKLAECARTNCKVECEIQ